MSIGKVYVTSMSHWLVDDVDTQNTYALSPIGCPTEAGDIIEYEKSHQTVQELLRYNDLEFVDCVRVIKTSYEIGLEQRKFNEKIFDLPVTHTVYVKDNKGDNVLILGCVLYRDKLYFKCPTGSCKLVYDYLTHEFFDYGKIQLGKFNCHVGPLQEE